ncbi:hypothetical protein [Pseudoalteromonas mariniglutinosa]|uniref:hypothetical protein n=1 Tax=Pseudoalteromonas mariniglutinosa TaxID=206042 RepID=UPI003850E90F
MKNGQFYVISVNFFFVAVILASCVADAEIYQCEKNNIVEFSQFPCGKHAQLYTLKEQRAVSPRTLTASQPHDLTQVDDYIRIRQIAAKIQLHQNKITTYTERMNEQVAALNNESARQAKTLTGAKQATALANQMQSVVERYTLLITTEQQNITQLVAEQAAIESKDIHADVSIQQVSTSHIDTFIDEQQIKRKLAEHHAKITHYQQQLNSQLAQLESHNNNQAHSLSQATFDNSRAVKMRALTSKFNTLIAIEQRNIEQLSKQQIDLQRL